MELTTLIQHYWPYTCLGAVTGFLVGLTGVGGGALMTPMLLVFGINPSVAVGTDLLYASITKSFAIWRYHTKKLINWHIVGLVCLGSLPSGLVIIAILHHLPDLKTIDLIIEHGIGFALLFVALFLIFKDRIMRRLDSEEPGAAQTGSHRRTDILTVCGGIILGALITITSIGAGALGIVLLLSLYPRLQINKIVGTDLSQALPIALLAAIGHMSLGNVNFYLLVALLIGSLPAVYLASRIATRVPEKIFRFIMAILLAGIGGRLIVTKFLLYFE